MHRSRILCAILLLCAGLGAPGPAHAQVDNAAITGSACHSGGLNWRGRLAPEMGPPEAAFGTTKMCWFTYKVNAKDPKADYYAVEFNIAYSQKGSYVWYGGDSKLRLRSSIKSKGGVFFLSPSRTENTDCKSITVGISYKFLSAGIPLHSCRKAILARSDASARGATWRVKNLSNFKTASVFFFQKVPKGKSPSFTFKYTWPYYKWNQPDANHDKWWFEEAHGAFKSCAGPC